MIELKEGMRVRTPSDEEVGKVNGFVLHPATNEVTHIIIQKGWLLSEDKVVPFQMVNAAGDELVLNEEVDFDQLPPFEEIHFVRATDERSNDRNPVAGSVYINTPGYYWYPVHPNLGYSGFGLGYETWPSVETTRNIPADTVPLKEGTDVISSDGEHVGNVERLVIDPASNEATHFVISQGLLFKDRKLVPAHWVKSVEEDKVNLFVPSRVLERLPAYQE